MMDPCADLTSLEKRVWLSSPTMHSEELMFMKKAYETNWMSTVGENIDEIERGIAEYMGRGYAVALSSGTAALHLAVRLAGERLYGDGEETRDVSRGVLSKRKVFCSDLTFAATVNPVAYEGGEAIFIDSEYETWNMDPEALKKAFELYPEVRLIVLAHLYGTPARIDEIREIAAHHQALIVEDAAESLGAEYLSGEWRETGSFGDYSVISFNGNKIITGSSGGMFLTDSKDDALKVRKWSTQSREAAPWYEHEELGYNYRMSNVIAGIVRGQLPHLGEHIAAKKAIYERYRDGLRDLPISMNPYDEEKSKPNFWLSALTILPEAMCLEERRGMRFSYRPEHQKSCPMEILETLGRINAEGRPIWKPMHLEPIYRRHHFVKSGEDPDPLVRDRDSVGEDIFTRGLCLPSDNKMSEKEQDRIIEAIKCCFM